MPMNYEAEVCSVKKYSECIRGDDWTYRIICDAEVLGTGDDEKEAWENAYKSRQIQYLLGQRLATSFETATEDLMSGDAVQERASFGEGEEGFHPAHAFTSEEEKIRDLIDSTASYLQMDPEKVQHMFEIFKMSGCYLVKKLDSSLLSDTDTVKVPQLIQDMVKIANRESGDVAGLMILSYWAKTLPSYQKDKEINL